MTDPNDGAGELHETEIVLCQFIESGKHSPKMFQFAELVREIDSQGIAELKEKSGRNILILGSGSVVSEFAKSDLIDEYRFLINPVALGSGKTLFQGVENTVKLKYLSTKNFSNGNVLLCYQPDKSADNE